MATTFVLTGGRTNYSGKLGKGLVAIDGKTGRYRDYVWRNGQMTLDLPDEVMPGIIKYLRRTYRAFPANSPALHEALAQDRANPALRRKLGRDDQGEVHPGAESGDPAQVQGDGEHHGSTEGGQAPVGRVTTGAEGGDPGLRPAGDGPGHPGDDRRRRISAAVAGLDAKNDEHWTQDGKPRIDAIETTSGLNGVSRADVDAAAPGVIRST